MFKMTEQRAMAMVMFGLIGLMGVVGGIEALPLDATAPMYLEIFAFAIFSLVLMLVGVSYVAADKLGKKPYSE